MTWESIAVTNAISGGIIWLALEYFWMSSETIIIMTVLLVLDFIAGVSEVYIKDRENLSSSKARQWLAKKTTRWLLPFIVVIVLRGAWLEDVNYLSSAICWIIIASEGYSILAHIYAINQPWNEHLPEIDALSALIKWISEFFKKTIEDKTPIKSEEENSLDDKEE